MFPLGAPGPELFIVCLIAGLHPPIDGGQTGGAPGFRSPGPGGGGGGGGEAFVSVMLPPSRFDGSEVTVRWGWGWAGGRRGGELTSRGVQGPPGYVGTTCGGSREGARQCGAGSRPPAPSRSCPMRTAAASRRFLCGGASPAKQLVRQSSAPDQDTHTHTLPRLKNTPSRSRNPVPLETHALDSPARPSEQAKGQPGAPGMRVRYSPHLPASPPAPLAPAPSSKEPLRR